MLRTESVSAQTSWIICVALFQRMGKQGEKYEALIISTPLSAVLFTTNHVPSLYDPNI